mmetsp:Transcript_20462/g.40513  ORF Transcript_20462/g.40513 Transcript_20462/m.40513 type:complete len:370 (+) Transcript_20462:120-1229(+)|eukprot:CAMPEP_0175093952 /NCGR_PEP_ID=MMETSP0086_2-20121207/3306_1 /TAXON_ID=136419 /ORGANISM="Unknown Unknown, Strain D1" /LENGTH=369 /DNA_ID=CAMNT_0016366987 /DNA_START=108 /DNA_END=1217 /DNA_ORIENTATION=-
MGAKAGNTHEVKQISRHVLLYILGAIVLVVGITLLAFYMGKHSTVVQSHPPPRNVELVTAKTHTNCTDMQGAVNSVRQVAQGKGYLHQFEYGRLHPCCIGNYPLDTRDIAFIVVTSSHTHFKAKAILDSWGKGLENLLLVSDVEDPDVGTVTFDELSSTSPSELDGQHHHIWAMKYIHESDELLKKYPNSTKYQSLVRMKSKKWFFLVDDDTWVNIPALVQLAGSYDNRCPVAFGYVWSHVWIEDLDYVSGAAGVLLSSKSFLQMAPSFHSETCPFVHYNDITFGRCTWAQDVQIIHHRGFFFDPPERSKDRHELIWFPPLAEAITYHYVHPKDMLLMSTYSNQRWQYQPKNTAVSTVSIAVNRDGSKR